MIVVSTKTFSSRADEQMLSYADALTQHEYGLSYGQYCGTKLLESIVVNGELPPLSDKKLTHKRLKAAEFIKGFSSLAKHPEIAELEDEEIRNLIASRYES